MAKFKNVDVLFNVYVSTVYSCYNELLYNDPPDVKTHSWLSPQSPCNDFYNCHFI